MCRLQNIAMRDYQESVTTGQTDRQMEGQTDPRQSDPYASQATQKLYAFPISFVTPAPHL